MKLIDLLFEVYKEEFELNLKEGLSKTVNIGKTINLLQKQFNYGFEYRKQNDDVFHVTFHLFSKKQFNNFLKYADTLGWFPSYVISKSYTGKWNEDIHPSTDMQIRFEAKFNEESVDKTPSVLYHIIPIQNTDKILKIGLVPKSRSKASYHPDRVYLGRSLGDVENLAYRMSKITGIKDYAVLQINTNKIPQYFKLYKDPNYPEKGYFTMNNIPPQAIEKIKDINL